MTPYRFGLLHMLPQPVDFSRYLSVRGSDEIACAILEGLVTIERDTYRLTEKGEAALKQAAKEPV